jgi:hypothetical protein
MKSPPIQSFQRLAQFLGRLESRGAAGVPKAQLLQEQAASAAKLLEALRQGRTSVAAELAPMLLNIGTQVDISDKAGLERFLGSQQTVEVVVANLLAGAQALASEDDAGGADVFHFRRRRGPRSARTALPPGRPPSIELLSLRRAESTAAQLLAYLKQHGIEYNLVSDMRRSINVLHPTEPIDSVPTGLSCIDVFLSAVELRQHLFARPATSHLIAAIAAEFNASGLLPLKRFCGIIEQLPSAFDEFLYATLKLPEKLKLAFKFDGAGNCVGIESPLLEWIAKLQPNSLFPCYPFCFVRDQDEMIAVSFIIEEKEAIAYMDQEGLWSDPGNIPDRALRDHFNDAINLSPLYIWLWHDREEQRLVSVSIFSPHDEQNPHIGVTKYSLDESSESPPFSYDLVQASRAEILSYEMPATTAANSDFERDLDEEAAHHQARAAVIRDFGMLARRGLERVLAFIDQ